MRIVADTSILVAAIRSRNGGSNALIRAAGEGRCTLLASVPLVLEYEAVLTRQEHLRPMGIGYEDIVGFLDYLVSIVEPVWIDYLWRPALVDPADEMVLEAAIHGRADAIVTGNLRHFAPAKRHGLAVLLPADVLRRMA